MKLGLLAASLVLVAGSAAGCGGDDGSSGGGSTAKTATTEEFCGAFQGFYDDLTSVTPDEKNLGKVLKDAAKKIEDVGTPKDIPDDAKEGLKLVLDRIDGLADDASADDISGLETSLSDADQKKSDAFSTYLDKTCPDIASGS